MEDRKSFALVSDWNEAGKLEAADEAQADLASAKKELKKVI